jgi:hypothetical protein
MHYSEVLKGSLSILWRYRLLWVFGFIIALTTLPFFQFADLNDSWQKGQGTVIHTGDGNFTFPGLDANMDVSAGDGTIIITPHDGRQPTIIHTKDGWRVELSPGAKRDLADLMAQIHREIPQEVTEILIGTAIIIAAVVLGIILVAALLRYPAEAALIRGVDLHAKTGEKASFRQLLRLGYSRTAWRFFLIDLIVRLPLFIFFAALFVATLVPLVLAIRGDGRNWLFGLVTSAALFLLLLVVTALTSLVLSLLMQFFRRAAALEELGPLAAIGRGMSLIFRYPKDVLVMALAMLGATIGWSIAAIPLVILLVPVFIALIVTGALAAVVVLFPAAALASLVMNDILAWILAGVLALVVFIPITVAPFTFLRGLLEVFRSSTWTLTYRELRALEGLQPEPPKAKVALAQT